MPGPQLSIAAGTRGGRNRFVFHFYPRHPPLSSPKKNYFSPIFNKLQNCSPQNRLAIPLS